MSKILPDKDPFQAAVATACALHGDLEQENEELSKLYLAAHPWLRKMIPAMKEAEATEKAFGICDQVIQSVLAGFEGSKPSKKGGACVNNQKREVQLEIHLDKEVYEAFRGLRERYLLEIQGMPKGKQDAEAEQAGEEG